MWKYELEEKTVVRDGLDIRILVYEYQGTEAATEKMELMEILSEHAPAVMLSGVKTRACYDRFYHKQTAHWRRKHPWTPPVTKYMRDGYVLHVEREDVGCDLFARWRWIVTVIDPEGDGKLGRFEFAF